MSRVIQFKPILIFGCLCVLFLFALNGLKKEDDEEYRLYNIGDRVEILVHNVYSLHTQMSYPYYSLPFCKPKDVKNKGFISNYFGTDTIAPSVYDVRVGVNSECRAINHFDTVANSNECTQYSNNDLVKFEEMINQAYRSYWTMDNLPAAIPNYDYHRNKTIYDYIGIPLGSKDATHSVSHNKPILHNHMEFNIKYNVDYELSEKIMIISFEVYPISRATDSRKLTNTERHGCPTTVERTQTVEPGNNTIYWTYSVNWEQTNIPWTERWHAYTGTLDENKAQTHWFSYINPLVFLTGIVAMFMMSSYKTRFAGRR